MQGCKVETDTFQNLQRQKGVQMTAPNMVVGLSNWSDIGNVIHHIITIGRSL